MGNYGKLCHLLVELKNKALWVLKRLNFECRDATNLRLSKVNELDEFRLWAYERLTICKERIKIYHDYNIEKRIFKLDDLVLLYNSRLRLFLSKQKSR